MSRGGDKIVTQNNNNIYNNNIINNNLSLKKEELSPYGDNKKESFPEGFSPEITLDEMFRQFWELYPRQRRYAPKKVKPKFEALLRSGEITFPELLSRVRAYAQSREVQQGYAKMPETWFNQQCWMKPDWDGNEIKAGGIISRWNILAEKHNLQTIDSLTNERTTKFNEEAKKLNLTLDEVFTQLDRHLKLSMRLRGKKQIKIAPGEYDIVNDEWRATLGFFLDKNNLARTLEGTFDDPDLVRFEEHKKQEAQEREREQAEREKQIQAEKEKIKQYRISIGLPPEET